MGKTKKFFMYLVLTVASLLSVFPLYYMFCASTNRSIDVIAGKLIPGTYLMENFKSLIAQQNLRLALWNSFRNATVLTVLCLLVCSIAGYGFKIYHDKAKDAVFTVLLTAMMIPFAAIMIPMFRMFSQLKMVNTMAAFMLRFDFHSVYDYDVPSGFPFFPARYHRSGKTGWFKRDRNFLPHVYADHEIDLCGSNDHHLYECMEQLSVAKGYLTEQ